MSRFAGLLFRFLAVIVASVVVLGALFSIAYYYELYTPADEEPPPILVLTGATVIPGDGKLPLPNATVIVGGERILRIEPEAAIPRDALVLGVEGLFVVPALLDAAVYFEAPSQGEIDTMAGIWEWEINRSLPERRRALVGAGVGTVLDLGSGLNSSLRTRSQLLSGEIAGPRLLASGPILTAPESSWLHARYPLRPEKTTGTIETAVSYTHLTLPTILLV